MELPLGVEDLNVKDEVKCKLFGFSDNKGSSGSVDTRIDRGDATSDKVCLNHNGYGLGVELITSAYNFASNLQYAIAAAQIAANAKDIWTNYRKLSSIKHEASELQKEAHDRMVEKFYPRDKEFLDTYGVAKEPEVPLATVKRGFLARLNVIVASAAKNKIRELKCGMTKWHTSYNIQNSQNLFLDKAKSLANANFIANNLAVAKHEQEKDVIYQRRIKAIAMGRDLFSKGISDWLAKAATGYNNLQNGLIRGVEDGFRGLGSASAIGVGIDHHATIMEAAGGDLRQLPLSVSSYSSQANSVQPAGFTYDSRPISAKFGGTPNNELFYYSNQALGDFNNQATRLHGKYTYEGKDSEGKPVWVEVDTEKLPTKYSIGEGERKGSAY